MKRMMLVSAAIAALALPLAAQDTTTPGARNPGENFVTNWDLDGDGSVTLDEVLERRGDLFASFDDDGDGKLTVAEFANHDQMRDAMWDTRDAQRAEMAPGAGQRPAQSPGQGSRQGPGQGFAPQGEPGLAGPGQEFAILDADADGAITADEFTAIGQDWFARFDRTGDGMVTLEDFGPARR